MNESKFDRIAVLSASLLTLAAIGCVSLGLWRAGTDLEWTESFIIQEGLLSHWQIWIGAAVTTQYTSWWLVRYAATPRRRAAAIASAGRQSHR